jgi:hypothetical protein
VEEDVFGPVIALPPPSGKSGKAKPGSVEERRQALYDRVSVPYTGRGRWNELTDIVCYTDQSSSEQHDIVVYWWQAGLVQRLSSGYAERVEEEEHFESIRSRRGVCMDVSPRSWWPGSSRSDREAGNRLFSTSTGSGVSSSPGTSPRARRRALPTHEVADVVVKSSKTPISTGK